MLKYTKWFVILLAVLLAAFVAVGFVLPSGYSVERSILIDAPPETVHRLVGDLRQWPEWSPWVEADPTIKTTFGPTTTGVGAHQTWTGKDGTGELTFTKSDPRGGIEYDMVFDDRFHASGALHYEATPDGTQVVWSMDGEMDNFIGRYMGLLMNSLVGPNFESGLAKLKATSEALPAEEPPSEEGEAMPEEAVG